MSHPVPPTADSAFDQPTDNAARVLWTRGQQCRTLAQVLGGDDATQAESDLVASCIKTRARTLIDRRLTSFDLCNVAVPHGFSPETTRSVVAAVGSGPHSVYAAALAQRLSMQLGVPSRAIYGYQYDNERSQALVVLHSIASEVPDLDTRPIKAPNPAAMVKDLSEGTLLVVGAPGGSWFQRQFFGPGVRIQAKASDGTIVVRHTPTRVYQVMQDPIAYGPHMRAVDAIRLADMQHVIVAEHGKLLGLVPLQTLAEALPTQELQDVMDEPLFLYADEHLDHAWDLINQHAATAIPVLDVRDRIVGTVTADDLGPRPLV